MENLLDVQPGDEVLDSFMAHRCLLDQDARRCEPLADFIRDTEGLHGCAGARTKSRAERPHSLPNPS